jgi:hypothetical protein
MMGRVSEGDHDGRVDWIEQRGDVAVAAFSWLDRDERRHRWAHLLKLRDGKIVDMQDFASPRTAAATMRLRAIFP